MRPRKAIGSIEPAAKVEGRGFHAENRSLTWLWRTLVVLLVAMIILFVVAQIAAFKIYQMKEDKRQWQVNPTDSETQFSMKTYMNLAFLRYDFANKILTSANLRRNAAFLVGIVSVLIGCLLVIAGVRRASVRFSASFRENLQTSFATSSPGVFVMAIGAAIMAIALLAGSNVQVTDPSLPTISINREVPSNGQPK